MSINQQNFRSFVVRRTIIFWSGYYFSGTKRSDLIMMHLLDRLINAYGKGGERFPIHEGIQTTQKKKIFIGWQPRKIKTLNRGLHTKSHQDHHKRHMLVLHNHFMNVAHVSNINKYSFRKCMVFIAIFCSCVFVAYTYI